MSSLRPSNLGFCGLGVGARVATKTFSRPRFARGLLDVVVGVLTVDRGACGSGACGSGAWHIQQRTAVDPLLAPHSGHFGKTQSPAALINGRRNLPHRGLDVRQLLKPDRVARQQQKTKHANGDHDSENDQKQHPDRIEELGEQEEESFPE